VAPVPVLLELPPRPDTAPAEAPSPEEITYLDMEAFSADNKCACAASDDNPY
jgi:hypothetical protein